MTRFSAFAAPLALALALAVPGLASSAHGGTHGGGGGGGGAGGLSSGTGVDVSWPQCGSALPTGQAFAIVGVNGGLANDYNACLGTEWDYALASAVSTPQVPAQSYLNTADPGNTVADWPSPANMGSFGTAPNPYGTCDYAPDGSGAGAMSEACAYVYGYDMVVGGISDGPNGIILGDLAAFHEATGGSLTAQPVWLDVETGNSWQSGSAGLAMNIADLNGMFDALYESARQASEPAPAVGIYSTAYQWNVITGTPNATTTPSALNLSGLDDWIPGARRLSAAKSNCTQSSFTAGTVSITQWTSGGLDYDHSCLS